MSLIYVYKEAVFLKIISMSSYCYPSKKSPRSSGYYSNIVFPNTTSWLTTITTTLPLGCLSLMRRASLRLLRTNIGLGIRVLFKVNFSDFWAQMLLSTMSFFRLLTPMQVWALNNKVLYRDSKLPVWRTDAFSGELCRLLDCPANLVTVLVGILTKFYLCETGILGVQVSIWQNWAATENSVIP